MKKMTSRQACLLTVTMLFSPAVRLFSAYLSDAGGKSGWLAPLLAGGLAALFFFVLRPLLKTGKNYTIMLKDVFGTVISRVLLVLYALWGIFLTALLLRYYAQRLTGTVYATTDMTVFVLVLAALCAWALSRGFVTVARMNEILLPVILLVSVPMLVLLSRTVSWEALLPVRADASLMHVTVYCLASFGYATLLLFWNDDLVDRAQTGRRYLFCLALISGLCCWLFLCVLGNLGPYLPAKLSYPFFAAVKEISVGEFLQHIEALTVTLWILSDFAAVAVLGETTLKTLGALASVHDPRPLAVPLFLLCAALALILGHNGQELEQLSQNLFVPANLVMLFGIPTLTCLVMKMKKAA